MDCDEYVSPKFPPVNLINMVMNNAPVINITRNSGEWGSSIARRSKCNILWKMTHNFDFLNWLKFIICVKSTWNFTENTYGSLNIYFCYIPLCLHTCIHPIKLTPYRTWISTISSSLSTSHVSGVPCWFGITRWLKMNALPCWNKQLQVKCTNHMWRIMLSAVLIVNLWYKKKSIYIHNWQSWQRCFRNNLLMLFLCHLERVS